MYNGPERRQTMDKDLQELKLEMASFTSKVNEWMSSTQDYRKQLCGKIDQIDNQLSNHITEITSKLNLLPCRERQVWYQSINRQLKWMWGITGGVIVAIFVEWLRKKS